MKRHINYDAQGAAPRIEHSKAPAEIEDVHEVDAEDLEELAPWEDPVQQVRATAQRQAHEEQGWREREQRKAKQEIARMGRRDAMSHEVRMEEMKGRQVADLRNREVRLQNQISETPWWKVGEKARLRDALQLTTERLNGLSESTPEQRQRQRQASVKVAVRGEAIQPIAMREKNLRDRINVPEYQTSQERLHEASTRRDSAWTRFVSIFRPSVRNKARAEVFAATAAYATEHRVNKANDKPEPAEQEKRAA